MPRLYFDTNIWYALLNKNDKLFIKSSNEFKRSEDPDTVIVVPTLLICEIVSVIRTRGATNLSCSGNPNKYQEKQHLEKIKCDIDVFLETLGKWEECDRIELIDPNDINFSSYIKEVYDCILDIHDYSNLRIITPYNRMPEYKYHGPGHWDIHHFIMAKKLDVDELITNDKGFEVINSTKPKIKILE